MNPPSLRVEPLTDVARCQLGESPVWDARLQRLYWVDITGRRVHWWDWLPCRSGAIELPDHVGFVALTDDAEMVILGLGAGLVLLRPSTGDYERLVELEPKGAGLRCNDGKCDPAGRLWAGTVPLAQAPTKAGSLYSFGGDSRIHRRLSDLGCSNGLAWNPTRLEMFFVDSLAHRIDRFRWNPKSGDLEARAPLACFPLADGLPDGLCIDLAGNLWVAFWDGACARHLDGRTGVELGRIDLPVTRVTSCTLGGPALDVLFITTAAEGLDDAALARQPLAGSLFVAQPVAPGVTPGLFPVRAAIGL